MKRWRPAEQGEINIGTRIRRIYGSQGRVTAIAILNWQLAVKINHGPWEWADGLQVKR